MPDDPSPEAAAEVFRQLRTNLFAHGTEAAAAAEIVGAVFEEGYESGGYLVAGFADGAASLYLRTGGGRIGGETHTPIAAAAREFARSTEAVASLLPAAETHPEPVAGQCRVSLLTSSGVRSAVVPRDAIEEESHSLFPAFVASQNIIRLFREQDDQSDPGPSGEMAYVDCLLTSIARGHGRQAVVSLGSGLPNPLEMTSNGRDRDWIESTGLDLDALDTRTILSTLSGMTVFGRLRKRRGKITVALAPQDGGPPTEVVFAVQKTPDGLSIGLDAR